MSAHFNKLTPAQHERLAILSEELGEAQQAIGKILRHGYDSCDPTLSCPEDERPPDNRDNLEKELGDIEFAIDMLTSARDIHGNNITRRAVVKAEKIKPYLHHQKSA